MPTPRALLPYGVLVIGLLVTSTLNRVLTLGVVGRILGSPAVWLLITGSLAIGMLRIRRGRVPELVRDSAKRGIPVAVTTAVFLLLGGLMAASGTSVYLADAASRLGAVYLFFIPLVGAVGGYITGSNSGASAMFSASTAQAAVAIGVDPLTAVASQNVGASAAVMASPPRVALALSVAAVTAEKKSATSDELEGASQLPDAGESAGAQPLTSPAQVTRVVLAVSGTVAVLLGVILFLLS